MNSQRPADGIVCVYCKTEKARPPRGEHIVLKGLGGRATISEVCAECNGLLDTRVDGEFLRSTHIALHRFFDPAVQEGEVTSPQFLPTEYGYIDVRLMNSGEMDILPQAAAHEEPPLASQDATSGGRTPGRSAKGNRARPVRELGGSAQRTSPNFNGP